MRAVVSVDRAYYVHVDFFFFIIYVGNFFFRVAVGGISQALIGR